MMKAISIIFILAFFVRGCDPVITLPVDDSDSKRIIFSCGSVSIKAVKSLGPGYIISHNFDLNREIKLYFDSLNISHNGNLLSYEVVDAKNQKLVIDDMLTLNKKRIINIDINRELKTGDTLLVNLKGFLMCDGTSIYNDLIKIRILE